MESLNKVFTVASTFSHDEDGNSNLLFSSLGNEPNILSADSMQQIIMDPLFHKIMGRGGILVRLERSTPTLLATSDVEKYAIRRMERADKDETVIIYDPVKGVRTVNLHDIYYSCTLPHKIIVGCVDCLDKETDRPCVIKSLDEQFTDSNGGLSPFEVTQELKNRKDNLAGFTYVSPRLTAVDHFTRTFRPIEQHNFNEIVDNSAVIQKGLRERGRRKRFAQTACPHCFIQEECKNDAYYWPRKHCEGPYNYTDKTACKELLKETPIPFTPKQLLFLALNSGRLDKRYNRRKYWATFQMRNSNLKFGLCRYTTGEFTPFENYKEAEELLRKYNKSVVEVEGKKRLTPQAKAVLLELAQRTYSPVRVSRWHSTYYSVLGIEYNAYNMSWELFFTYNTNNHWHRSGGEDPLVLPWTVQASNLHDIYKEYTDFRGLSKTDHADSYGVFHYGRANRW